METYEVTLTRHFEQRWMERVGNWPTPDAIAHYISQSVKIQTHQTLILEDGLPHQVPAIYWHPELNIVMLVDESVTMRLVTLLTENNRKKKGRR